MSAVSLRHLWAPVAALTVGSLLALLLACGASTATLPAFDGNLPLGTWGGDSAGLIVGDTAMHLHIACTYGDVSGRISVDATGHFDVAGSYMLRAYPVAVGPAVPARFVGHLDGGTITVTVVVDDTVMHQTITRGPVVAKYGDEPRLGPCPICRRPVVTATTEKRSP
jgi:hypothetical protein